MVAKLEGFACVHGNRITIYHQSSSKQALSSSEQRPMLASHTLNQTLHKILPFVTRDYQTLT